MVNRLRLEGAAATLLYSKHRTITEIAFDHGYSSAANFTKAFTRYFNCPPSVYRKEHDRTPLLSKNGKARQGAISDNVQHDKQVNIVEQPELELAYLRHTGPYKHDGLARLHSQVQQWVSNGNYQATENMNIGITWSDSHIAAEERWRYDACFAVKKGTRGSGPISIQTLPRARVAQLSVSFDAGKGFDLSPHWNWFVGHWLMNSEHVLNDSPSYEIYDQTEPERQFELRLCLPLA